MIIDWKRNNKIGIRNFRDSTDFHDIVKTLLVRMLRRKHPDAHSVPIYTEFSPTKTHEEYPDIWMKIKTDIIVYEIQKDVTRKWSIEIQHRYQDCDLIIVPLIEIQTRWTKELNKKDPIESLRKILEDYVV